MYGTGGAATFVNTVTEQRGLFGAAFYAEPFVGGGGGGGPVAGASIKRMFPVEDGKRMFPLKNTQRMYPVT